MELLSDLICPICGNTTITRRCSFNLKPFEPIEAQGFCYSCDYTTPIVRSEEQVNQCVLFGIQSPREDLKDKFQPSKSGIIQRIINFIFKR